MKLCISCFALSFASACLDTLCPPVLVPVTQRGDGVCQPSCDSLACSYDYGDCVTDAHPLPFYVSATVSAGGDGSETSPFASLQTALSSLWAKSSVVYLLTGTHMLDGGTTTVPLALVGNVTIKTLLCDEAMVQECAVQPAIVQLTANYSQIVVGTKLVVEGVGFEGGIQLKEGCQACVDCPLASANSNGLWVDSSGIAVAEQSACDYYSSFVLFTAPSNTTLNLTKVSFANIRHQPKALIVATCAQIFLQGVRFTNITTRKSGLGGATIMLQSDSVLCGTFQFEGGLVELLNNGFAYSRDESNFSGFLWADNVETVTISGVTIRDALMSRAVVVLKRFGQTRISECRFEGNIVTEAVIYVLSNVAYSNFAPHISITNSVFSLNFGRLNGGVWIMFQSQPQTIEVRNCTFSSNFAQSFGVFDLRNFANLDNSVISQAVILSNLTFDSNIAPFVCYLNNTATVRISDVLFTGNGDSALGLTGESVIVEAYTARFDTVARVVVPTLLHRSCTAVISFINTNESWLRSSRFENGYCKMGSPGVVVKGDSSVRCIQVEIGGLSFEGNLGRTLVVLNLDHDVTLSDLSFHNNSNPYSLDPSCLSISLDLSVLTLSYSRFSNNSAQATTVASFSGIQSLFLDSVLVANNSARSLSAGISVIVSQRCDSQIHMSNVTFDGNYANSSTGLLISMNQGLNIHDSDGLTLIISNSKFLRNFATYHGAAVSFLGFLNLKKSLVSNSVFQENACNEGGAAVYAEFNSGMLAINSVLFDRNTGQNGAAVFFRYLGAFSGKALLQVSFSRFLRNSGDSIVSQEGIWTSNVTSLNNTFESNRGSCVHVSLCTYNDAGSVFRNNSATRGTVLWCVSGKGAVYDFWGEGNTADVSGAVLFASVETNLSCTNCTFLSNRANVFGGVLYLDQLSNFYGINMTMIGNAALDRGAALYAHRSVVIASQVILRANNVGNFGVIFLNAATFSMSNSDMSENVATSRSPGIVGTFSVISIFNSSFHDQYGLRGGSFFLTDQTTASISFTNIWNNTSESGGAFVVIALSAVSISDSHMWNCSATTDGGLLTSRISTIEFVRVIAENITSTLTFGAIFLLQSTWRVTESQLTDMVGSAAYAMASDVTITNSFFARVFAGIGAGLNCAECTSLLVNNSRFSGGLAKVGGVINSYTMGTSSTLLKSSILNSRFENSCAVNGGAISSDSFYLTLINNTFFNNSASPAHYDPTGLIVQGTGGAVYSICPSIPFCEFLFENNVFEKNVAHTSGGAIFWANSFPVVKGNVMIGNVANYGSNIGSFAVRLAKVDEDGKIEMYLDNSKSPLIAELVDVGSGYVYNGTLVVALVDQYDHIVATDFSSSAQLFVNSTVVTVSGNIQVIANYGIFTFSEITIVGPPKTSQTLIVRTNGIDLARKKSSRDPTRYIPEVSVKISFRDCYIGESLQANECRPCPINTFSLNPSNPCMSCPNHVSCHGTYLMVPDPGYWRPDSYSSLIFECINADACLGSPDPRNLSLTGQCGNGYMSNLCSACEDKYSSQGNGVCSLCPSLTSNLVMTGFLVISVLIAFSVIVAVAIRGAQRPRSELAIFLKILMNYLQMIMVASSLNLSWPKYVNTFLRGQQVAGNAADQLMSIECLLKQFSSKDVFYTNVAVYVIVPGAVMLLSSLFWLICKLIRGTENAANKAVASLVLLVFVLHTSVTKVMFSMFTCRELLPAEFWLASNLSIRCWDEQHVKYIFSLALPGIVVWVIGLPTLCLVALVKLKRELSDTSVRLRFSFLFKGYRSEWYFWEFVILYRKIVIVCTSVFLTTVSITIQALSMLAVVLVCIFLQLYVKPFFGPEFNTLELKALLASLLTIYAGLFFQTNATRKY